MNSISNFRDIRGLTRFLQALLWLGALLAFISLISAGMQYELLSRESFSEMEGKANDSREQVVALSSLLIYFFTVIVFSRWIYLSHQNVRALGVHDLRISPGWAVGYFFIPILNLWKPYQAMSDLWKASREANWHEISAGPILWSWWTLFISSNLLGQVAFRATLAAQDLRGFKLATILGGMLEVINLALCLVAITLVSEISRSQRTREFR